MKLPSGTCDEDGLHNDKNIWWYSVQTESWNQHALTPIKETQKTKKRKYAQTTASAQPIFFKKNKTKKKKTKITKGKLDKQKKNGNKQTKVEEKKAENKEVKKKKKKRWREKPRTYSKRRPKKLKQC